MSIDTMMSCCNTQPSLRLPTLLLALLLACSWCPAQSRSTLQFFHSVNAPPSPPPSTGTSTTVKAATLLTSTPTPTRPLPTPTPTPAKTTPTPSPTPSLPQTARPPIVDIAYNDDNIHFTQLVRFSDWNSMAWGVNSMTVGTRVMYDKNFPLSHISWRLVQDPVVTTQGAGNTILLSKSVVHVVSRDGKLVWSCGPDGYMVLADYATALQGGLIQMSLIRATIADKHGQAAMSGVPLPRGFQWSKMKFGAAGGSEVTPSDSGLAWQSQSDDSYKKNRKAWEYGFEVQDVDYNDPSIL